jgi:membrane protease YdiL (CAAX protease family)
LCYLAAWALWAPLVVFSGGLPPALGFVLGMLGTLVPSTVGVLLVAVLQGRRGVRRLFGRVVKWRVGVRWYLVVLLVPLLVPAGLALSILLGGSVPTVSTSVLLVLAMFATSIFPGSALGEELGWRGFALPHLQNGHSALAATLILGPLWGVWHLPLWLTGSPSNPLALFPIFVISVVAMSVLLTWLYNSTEGSLLLVVLLHATANLPVTFLITPLGGRAMILPYACYTVLLIMTAAIVVVTNGAADLSRTHRKQVSEPSETALDKPPVA